MAERDDTADAAAVEPGEESPTPGGRGPTLAEQLKVSASRQFAGWLVERKASLAFTTYQAGKLFMLGIKEGGRLSIFERTFPRCMGLTGDGQTLWMSSLFQFWRFENALEPGQDYRGYDRLYVPQAGYTTGDIDAHAPSLVNTPEEPVTVITIPPASAHTAARHTSSAPITCHLHLSGDEHAEGRVRNILGRDPRVLVSPAPQVRTGMGELEVSYALLPGLTAGERSLLEQQLRDTVT